MGSDGDEKFAAFSAAWWEGVSEDLEAYGGERRGRWGGLDEEMLGRYVDGECSPSERTAIERVAREHPAVREFIETLRSLDADRESDFQEAGQPSEIPPPFRRGRGWKPHGIAAAIAASILIGVIGLFAYNRRELPEGQVASLERRAGALRDAPADSDAVKKLRADLLGSPLAVVALAWESDTLPGFMARTRPAPASYVEELGVQVARLDAAGFPARYGRFTEAVYRSVREEAGRSGLKLGPVVERFLLAGRKPGEKVGMIVPADFYTMDDPSRARWDRIVALAGPDVAVKIVNTRAFSEDFAPTPAYEAALEHARSKGVEVFAYVNCDGGDRSLAAAKADVLRWHDRFPGRFRGIYFDNQMGSGLRLDYFAELFHYARQVEPGWKIISATDETCDEAYAKILGDSILCYKTEGRFPRFKGWEGGYDRGRFAAVIDQADRLSEADFLQAAAVFGWVYAIGTTDPVHRYRTLPPFLEEEAALLRRLNAGNGRPPTPGKVRRTGRTML